MSRLLTAAVILALLAPLATSQEGDKKPADAAQAKTQKQWTSVDVYPLGTCLISGKSVTTDSAKTFQADGRTFKTCCGKCQAKIEKSPEDYVKKLDAAVIAAQEQNYPLDKCPVSGKALGAMGSPHEIVLDNHLVKLCCEHCVAKATAKKDEIVAKIEAAAYEKQRAAYPLKTCVVSGEELEKKTVDIMVGDTLVRFCCDDCIADFKKDPAQYLAKLNAKPGAEKGEKSEGGESAHPAKKAKEGDKESKGQMASSGSCCESGAAESKGCCGSGCCGEKPEQKADAKGDVKGEQKADAKPVRKSN